VFGWISPDDGLRNYTMRGIPAAFGQAAIQTGDMRYIDAVRRQVDNLYGSGDVLRSQVRYFDPERRRAGLAEDVAALVEKIDANGIVMTIVDTRSGAQLTH
jgi:hypothetical protein